MLPPRFAERVRRRSSHAGAAVVLIVVTVALVIQSTVGVAAVAGSVASLLTGPIRVPPQKCPAGSNAVPHRQALVLYDDRGAHAAYAVPTADLDRSFAVADLMAGMFGPVRSRHRMLVRLEDVGSATDPAPLRQVADLLSADRIPFSIALYPVYVGPV